VFAIDIVLSSERYQLISLSEIQGPPQSGHLVGRTFKKRRRIEAKPAALAFAIWLAQASGFTGNDVLSNGWVTTLDLDQERLEILLERVRAAGLVEIRQLGPHVEIDSSRLLTRAAA